ncbi:hypothetical protein GCM10023153_21320 [Ornithinibacter aureus]|uniref:DUF2510 domain-containing protein n=1 Tax=Ornithinibacter aureus TaxID=622664 RepID=A0ABP8JY65_9MICO|nr:DUF2510 domain-containing protein [Ornithinibacter aureus]KAF0834575.1 uncharacterized protein DUF2510 [Ornithinibacter aureus]
MSAPAGWHLQPDGQERFWDGTQWTDQFRSPAPIDPTAPPPAPSWASSSDAVGDALSDSDSVSDSDHTQVFDVAGTQALPRQDAAAPGAYPPAGQASVGYPQQGYPQQGYPQQGYAPGQPQTGYGAPGSAGYPPPVKSGSSGLAKGCLIAGVVLLGLIAIVIAAIAFFAPRVADSVNETFPSGFPTSLPSGFPTDLPTDLPSGLPTDLPSGLPTDIEQNIELTVGDGFELPRATIDGGWTLVPQGSGIPIVNITGMKATLGDANGFPVLFTMRFPAAGGETVETVCTTPGGEPGAVVDVSCVPLFGDVAEARTVTVTASL